MIDIKISANANIINNNFQEEARIYQHDFRTKILDPNQEDIDWENEDFTKRTNKNINSHLSIFNQIIYFTPEQTLKRINKFIKTII